MAHNTVAIGDCMRGQEMMVHLGSFIFQMANLTSFCLKAELAVKLLARLIEQWMANWRPF